MKEIFNQIFDFSGQALGFALLAMFFENIIFTRAIGTSTSLFVVRKKINLFRFGTILVVITTLSSLLTWLIYPLIKTSLYKYYITPIVYVIIIGFVYIAVLLFCNKFLHHHKKEINRIIHITAFNCAVLGLLLLSSSFNFSLAGFIGFGIGGGIGFCFATYLIAIAYKKLNSKDIPRSFRGFPVTLIYIGILSLAFYGLIGHELPF